MHITTWLKSEENQCSFHFFLSRKEKNPANLFSRLKLIVFIFKSLVVLLLRFILMWESLNASQTVRFMIRAERGHPLRHTQAFLKVSWLQFRFRIWSESQSKPSTSPEPLTAQDAWTDHCRNTKVMSYNLNTFTRYFCFLPLNIELLFPPHLRPNLCTVLGIWRACWGCPHQCCASASHLKKSFHTLHNPICIFLYCGTESDHS